MAAPSDIPAPVEFLHAQPAQPGDPAGEPIRVAVIDADEAATRALARRSEAFGWRQRVFAEPPPIQKLAEARAAALLVDADSCPDISGYVAAVATALPEMALIVLAGESSVAVRVRALRVGADDWITKPAHPDEVIARVEAVIRRRRSVALEGAPDPFVAGELEIRPDRFQAYVSGASVGLTRREYELLELLAAAGRVVEREEIYERVWGYTMVRGDRSVDVFVGKVRSKLLAASPAWHYVHTHIGVGYRFGAEPAA